ncbi:MAG: ABC transporter substrate-binding protein, partial [Methylobacteriaceae bacterium]|nr:ABC transporter substrate-binding protein [Methylobacteriaceae bacterium]
MSVREFSSVSSDPVRSAKQTHLVRRFRDLALDHSLLCIATLAVLAVAIVSVDPFTWRGDATASVSRWIERWAGTSDAFAPGGASSSTTPSLAVPGAVQTARSGSVSPDPNYPYGTIGGAAFTARETKEATRLPFAINDVVAPPLSSIASRSGTIVQPSGDGVQSAGFDTSDALTSGRAIAVAETPSAGAPSVRGISQSEIRFGIAAPFSGPARELGRQMKIGIDTAFNAANAAGGINGRQLKLFAVDDGYEPTRTADAMKQLVDRDEIFATIGSVGTPTAAVALPFALERKMLFFGAFTGAGLLRAVPPDHYVFNYRPSYAEETEAVVQYLLKTRNLQPREIAVFAQQDAYGDAGFEGVTRALRRAGYTAPVLRLNYTRNTIDVTNAVAQLRAHKTRIRAVVMVAAYRAAANFIEKTRDRHADMIYTNVSFVGSTALADELKLQGEKFVDGVIVTQVVPAVNGFSKAVLDYKTALAKYFPGEAPDDTSLEGY